MQSFEAGLAGHRSLLGGDRAVVISVVIPTLNAGNDLAATLSALVPGVVDGIVRDVTVVDGGSHDQTLTIADQAGATILQTKAGRGQQLQAGGAQAKSRWLLFLHGDTVLEAGWDVEAAKFIEKMENSRRPMSAAAFRFALDDDGFAPRLLELMVGLRSSIFRLPYGDQGLLISRQMYEEIGGYNPMSLMEDVDIVRRLGRRRITLLKTQATTSAEKYRRDGYAARVARNQMCLLMYAFKAPMSRISTIYGTSKAD